MRAEDRELVGSFLRTRGERAFRELYRAHTPALWLFVVRLVGGDRDDADDIVQETWLRAVAKLSEFRWESSLRTWLHAVALNVHREALRRRAGHRARVGEARQRLAVVTGPKPPPVDLERAIARLPDGYREILILHDIEGYTHREIAELLEIEEGTSKSQLSRARRAMRASLESHGADADAR